jgi:2-oxoisovalerate dehydrogenase E2 component (dihydrolipoyl transacylase)
MNAAMAGAAASRHFEFKVPDLGEGTVSSEVVAWKVAVGDWVQEDAPLAELATDKAVVEVSSPVSGRVVRLNGQPGDAVAVGSVLAVFALADTPAPMEADPLATAGSKLAPAADDAAGTESSLATVGGKLAPTADDALVGASLLATASHTTPHATRALASPATRRRASEAGVDLLNVAGTGPGGRVLRSDLDRAVASQRAPAPVDAARGDNANARSGALPTVASKPAAAGGREGITEIPVIGVRRVIAQRMEQAKRTVPHFSYVEEVDVTALEALRLHLNARRPREEAYSYLPFIMAALARVLREFPQCNAHYDAARNVVLRHAAVHVGVATQTPDGLKVPVVRHVEALTLAQVAAEVRRVSAAARNNTARRDELGGSTITVTSLGKLGGIASTPVLNLPEVAIIGLNKAVERPVVAGGAVVVRRMMNLSSSFDHRFVDGFDAAAMVQALKERLEQPATIFMAE